MRIKTLNIMAICTLSFWCIEGLLYGQSDALYNGKVGNVNSDNPHMLGGNVKVSGVNVPTDLSLNLVLSNGKTMTVGTIPVTKDGTYPVAQVLDPLQISSGEVSLNISSSNGLSDKNVFVDLSIFEIPNGNETSNTSLSNNGFIAKVGNLSPETMSLSGTTLNNVAISSPLTRLSASASSRSATVLSLTPQESASLPTSLTPSIDNITYNANNMVVGVNSNTLARDAEGNVSAYRQTATVADANNSTLEELTSIFGSKTLNDWNNFNWNSSITQAALNYLLAVHKGQITSSISITADNAKTIRQGLLARLSYVNRSLINGCLSAYDLDFTGINLQYCDWRYRLSELTPAQLLLAARSIRNVRNAYAGLQGACLPAVTFTGTEDFTNVSLAYVYIGYWSGFTTSQLIQVAKVKGGVVGMFFNESQYNSWVSTLITHSITICSVGGWDGRGYWEDPFNQLWEINSGDIPYGNTVQNNPNQFITCTYE